ncbi:AI-2E family transporter [Sorangium sp. So ce854]|uniref:AI-2E family transporter n=1 Tax=Sorangium sp. So ce854 TaxID=3133322 RepID=UPI003F5FF648
MDHGGERQAQGPQASGAPSVRASVLAVAGGLVALGLAVHHLWSAVLSLLIGGAVYYLLAPLVSLLQRWRVPRIASTFLLAGLLGAGAAAAAGYLGPRVYSEFSSLVSQLPHHLARLEQWLVEESGVLGEGADERVQAAIDQMLQRSGGVAMDLAHRMLGVAMAASGSASSVLFGLITGFYLLLSGHEVARGIPRWIPPAHRERWVRFGRASSRVLAAYVRARVIASLFIGVSYWIAFALLGLHQALLLAVVGGLLNFIPVVGPLLAAIPAVIVAAFQGLELVLGVALVMLAAQQVESLVIGPLLEGRSVRLPPVAIVLVVAAGAAVAGVPGMLLATPTAGLARTALDIFYREAWREPAG